MQTVSLFPEPGIPEAFLAGQLSPSYALWASSPPHETLGISSCLLSVALKNSFTPRPEKEQGQTSCHSFVVTRPSGQAQL